MTAITPVPTPYLRCSWCKPKKKSGSPKPPSVALSTKQKRQKRKVRAHSHSDCPFVIRLVFRAAEQVGTGMWYVKKLNLMHRGHLPLRTIRPRLTDEHKDRIAELRLTHGMDYAVIMSFLTEVGVACTSRQVSATSYHRYITSWIHSILLLYCKASHLIHYCLHMCITPHRQHAISLSSISV
jgi:hypothetical protein